MTRLVTNDIAEILARRTAAVVDEMGNEFSTREFIWKFMDMFETDYLEMLDIVRNNPASQENQGIFHNLHAQIGKYLLGHDQLLGINKIDEIKEPDINPFGRKTPTKLWRKTTL